MVGLTVNVATLSNALAVALQYASAPHTHLSSQPLVPPRMLVLGCLIYSTGPLVPIACMYYSRFHMHWTVSVTLMCDPCMGSWILHCLALGIRSCHASQKQTNACEMGIIRGVKRFGGLQQGIVSLMI